MIDDDDEIAFIKKKRVTQFRQVLWPIFQLKSRAQWTDANY